MCILGLIKCAERDIRYNSVGLEAEIHVSEFLNTVCVRFFSPEGIKQTVSHF